MPVFNLELKFDDKGALEAVNKIDQVTDATDNATEATDKLRRKGSKNLEELANSASDAAKTINSFKKETEQATQQIGNISNSAANTGKIIDQLGKSVQDAIAKLSNISPVTDKANQSTRQLGEEADKGSKDLSEMGDKGSKAADAIADKMKSAAKQVLGLVAAFTVVDKAMDFMNRGLEFNASLEQSQIGIASLITSMVKLQDSQGNLLEGQQKYNAAQEISAGLMKQIQQLGLQTTADSKSIIEGFQSILAPALEAGIALEKIPQFAVSGAQALQTLGVPLNQMRTELDALLTGSVNLSQDILAPKLFADVKGNLKEYIQGLKQAGKLEEEIFKRLEPYNLALKDTENTWAAISSNLGEALDKLAGDTSLNYTRAMKESLSEIQKLLIDTKTGDISKEFENIAKLLANIQDWIGNKIVASTQTLIGYVKDINSFLGSDIGQGTLIAFTTALKLAAGALAGFAAAKVAAFTRDKTAAAVDASRAAMERYKQSLISTAQIQKQAAYAELARYQAFLQTAQGQRQLMASSQSRQAMLAREIQLVNAATAAEQRLIAAQSGAKFGAMGAFKSMVNVLGGPLNTALIAAGIGMATLASMQSKAEKAADLHSNALKTLNELTEEASKKGLTLAGTLDAISEARRKLAIESENEAIKKLDEALSGLDFNYAELDLESGIFGQFQDIGVWLKEITKEFISGKKSAEEYGQGLKWALDQIGDQAPQLKSIIIKALDFTEAREKSVKTLDELQGKIKETSESTKDNITVVNESKNSFSALKEALDKVNSSEKAHVNTLEGALKWLEKRNANTEEGKKSQDEMAKATDLAALSTLNAAVATAEFNAEAANMALLSGNVTQAMINTAMEANNLVVKLKQSRDTFVEGMKSAKWGQSGTGTKGRKSGASDAKKIDDAVKKWRELNDQLAILEGKSTGTTASLNKTLQEIEDTGKKAKKSAQEIEALQKAFQEATDTKTIKELNKELLQLEGNTRAVEQIENQEKTDQFKARLSEIKSLSEDEKNILLGRYEQAIQTQIKVNDLQVAVDFMKDLESLGGQYGETLQMQNELIDYQAQLYREKLPADMQEYVNKWEELKKLENDTSFMAGLQRGVKKFGSDYADLATTVENFTVQMGNSIGNTLSDAFMKGKLSMQDFFSSLISMAAQAASNYFIGQIFSGIGEFFTSSGGTHNGLNASAATGAANTSGYAGMGMRWSGGSAKGNVFSGGNITGFSGKIVKGPTVFDYDRHLTTYAKGAGLMGEAGPEAIIPLKRMDNGELGVRMAYDMPNNNESANYARVISELQAQMRSERQYNNGNMPVINLNIENNSNAQVQAGQMQADGNGGFSMDIIISQVEQGIVGRMKQGKSQIAQYQEKTYGMNRAGVIARGRGRN